MAGTNKGHYEPCWVPLRDPSLIISEATLLEERDRYRSALEEIEHWGNDEDWFMPIVREALNA